MFSFLVMFVISCLSNLNCFFFFPFYSIGLFTLFLRSKAWLVGLMFFKKYILNEICISSVFSHLKRNPLGLPGIPSRSTEREAFPLILSTFVRNVVNQGQEGSVFGRIIRNMLVSQRLICGLIDFPWISSSDELSPVK